jgi:hypothetical protein
MNGADALTSSIKGIPGWFIPLWCTAMPLTSFVLIPGVQGTIPAYMLAFASVFFVASSRAHNGQGDIQRMRYFTLGVLVAGIWLLLFCGSQLGHLISNRHNFGDLLMIDRNDSATVVFRSSLFTQSLYLAACVCIALFFRFFFREEWMRYVLWGAWFLAIYGIYEWLFYLIFKQPGDFIVNRTYGEGNIASWSQTIQIGPFNLLRLKSTFGEPSFLSAGVLPYFFLAREYKRKWLAAALFFCVIFSTSTSAYLGLAFALTMQGLFQRKLSRSNFITLLLFLAAFLTLYYVFPETYHQMFDSKLSGENDSGRIRQQTWAAMQDTANTFSFMNCLFGIGFGYSYNGVYSAVVVNTGWIGLMVYCYAFLKPVLFLRPEREALALKLGIATLFFLFYVTVSELFLPTTWMFLGLAYWRLNQQRNKARVAQIEDPDISTGLPSPRGEPLTAICG